MSGPNGQNPPPSSLFFQPGNTDDDILAQVQSAETRRRAAIRQVLLRDAQNDFYGSLAGPAKTAYARDLSAEEQQLNVMLLEYKGLDALNGAIILDPAKFDTGMALGLSPVESVRAMIDRGRRASLQDAGIDAPDSSAIFLFSRSDMYNLPGIAQDMSKPVDGSRFGISTYTQFPSERTALAGTSCVIVPASEKTDPFRVKGLSYDENLTYTNLHEGAHCGDPRTSEPDPDPSVLTKFKPEDDIGKLPDDPGVRHAYARNNQEESYADCYAVGEMIRGGKPLSVLDAVADWRKDNSWEVRHYTVPALKGLREAIDKMGVENFRKLDEQQAIALYNKSVDDHALNAKRVEAIQHNESHNPLKNGPLWVTQFTDKDVSAGLAFRRSQNLDRFVAAVHEAFTPAPAEPALEAAISKWDASKALKDRAFGAEHKITPRTLANAYNAIHDELQDQVRKDPAQARYFELQMTKLQQTFVADVPKMDYVQVNLDRGVNIEAVENSLKPFNGKPEEKKPVRTKSAQKPAPAGVKL